MLTDIFSFLTTSQWKILLIFYTSSVYSNFLTYLLISKFTMSSCFWGFFKDHISLFWTTAFRSIYSAQLLMVNPPCVFCMKIFYPFFSLTSSFKCKTFIKVKMMVQWALWYTAPRLTNAFSFPFAGSLHKWTDKRYSACTSCKQRQSLWQPPVPLKNLDTDEIILSHIYLLF